LSSRLGRTCSIKSFATMSRCGKSANKECSKSDKIVNKSFSNGSKLRRKRESKKSWSNSFWKNGYWK